MANEALIARRHGYWSRDRGGLISATTVPPSIDSGVVLPPGRLAWTIVIMAMVGSPFRSMQKLPRIPLR
jgi:hypothetical protein